MHHLFLFPLAWGTADNSLRYESFGIRSLQPPTQGRHAHDLSRTKKARAWPRFRSKPTLETEVTNKVALGLYEKLGFARDERLFKYYLNGVDAYRLKLWFH